MAVEVGAVFEGIVVGITSFGAFIELPGGKKGLVHISEVADEYVRDVRDYLKDRERVKVKVIGVDEKGKISLSIRQAREGYKGKERSDLRSSARLSAQLSFEDRLAKFLKESEERQKDFFKKVGEKRKSSRGTRKNRWESRLR